ncbi:Rieske 2Fe-2S domain-containing protein [Bordetella sp. BOR01]|uniref:Rieske (2Fe-2S) protein n=1 Tax=Bordetella sp. BOR01 TaxID=2854779 RepID=UPI001C44E2BB|nr:Rieske 2Fe-2S domain-containing protein [Bordetella sp. BOR01]MBV7485837.1 Rieske 2Fe-2S domain-containing protein [Bordetella sp. BOR01]
MSHTAPPCAVRICASTALVDGGLGMKFPATDGIGPTTVFFVRYQGRAYGYVNRCAHVGVELDWENSFFTRAGNLLMCARHGATYQPDTGLCVGGPCKHGRLAPLQVQERDGAVYWLPGERVRPRLPDAPGPAATAPA